MKSLKSSGRAPADKGSLLSPSLVQSWIDMLFQFKKGAKAKPKTSSPDIDQKKPAPSELEIKKILNLSFKDVQALWESYNKGDKNSRRLFHDPNRERQAYLCGFHLSNVAKFSLFLNRLEMERPESFGLLSDSSVSETIPTLKIIDIGCGTGAFSQALLSKINSSFSSIEVLLVDKSKQFLEVAEFGVQNLLKKSNNIRIEKKILDILKPEFAKFLQQCLLHAKTSNQKTILLFGNVLNEILIQLGENTLDAFIQNLFKNIQSHKIAAEILISEPVHKGFAKKMMEIRETLVNSNINCLYPCPSSTQNCPLLARKQFRDYCYSDFKWDAPIYFRKYSEALDLDRSYLSSSLYFFSSSELRSIKVKDNVHVLVGKPIEKESIKLLQCTKKGIFSERTEKFSTKSNQLRGQII